jgi:hypothetical protein
MALLAGGLWVTKDPQVMALNEITPPWHRVPIRRGVIGPVRALVITAGTLMLSAQF